MRIPWKYVAIGVVVLFLWKAPTRTGVLVHDVVTGPGNDGATNFVDGTFDFGDALMTGNEQPVKKSKKR